MKTAHQKFCNKQFYKSRDLYIFAYSYTLLQSTHVYYKQICWIQFFQKKILVIMSQMILESLYIVNEKFKFHCKLWKPPSNFPITPKGIYIKHRTQLSHIITQNNSIWQQNMIYFFYNVLQLYTMVKALSYHPVQ